MAERQMARELNELRILINSDDSIPKLIVDRSSKFCNFNFTVSKFLTAIICNFFK